MSVKQFEINDTIKKLVDSIKAVNSQREDKTIERIKLSDVTSSIAFWYEKIRNTVDYKDEHLLAKNATERILKRLIFIEEKRTNIAQPLVYELIRGRYLLNDTVPITKIPEIETIIAKYLILFQKIETKYARDSKFLDEITNWFVAIAAFEIEKNLISMQKEETLVESMYDTVASEIVVSEKLLSERDAITQIYVSILRSLFKTDQAMLSYYLLRVYYPDWFSSEWEAVIDELVDNIPAVKRKIDRDISNPIGERLLKFCKKRAVSFLILFDLINQKPDKFLKMVRESQIIFEKEVRAAALVQYEKAKEKVGRTVTRSMLYILITKSILALIIEIPYEQKLLQDGINYFTLGINIIFPLTLMYLIGSSAKIPVDKNTEQVIKEVDYAVYKNRKREEPPYIARLLFPESSVMTRLFNFLYLATFLVSFGMIVYVLDWLKFNIVSGFLFIFFLTIVSFFGIKIRQSIKDFVVVEGRESVFGFIFDLLTLPIIRAGRFISERFSQVNVFVFVLDLIIEAPFKLFVQIFEEWIKFLKEKKEEIY